MGERENIRLSRSRGELQLWLKVNESDYGQRTRGTGTFVNLHGRWDMPEVSRAPAMFLPGLTIRFYTENQRFKYRYSITVWATEKADFPYPPLFMHLIIFQLNKSIMV